MLDDLRYNGRLDSDIAVLEMDEAHAAKILQRVRPTTVVMTNIGTDQVDRFADPADVAQLLDTVARSATARVISNADDAMLEQIVESLPVAVYRYGVCQKVLDATPHGLGNARQSDHRLASGTIVESVSESTSSIRHGDEAFEVSLPARGPHYAVDVAAAIAAASAILGAAFSIERARAAIAQPDPVFGRNQLVEVRGKAVEMVLVQNPASFQLNIDYLPDALEQVMVAVGSDVRDFSYLWPVDTSVLSKVDMVSGTLAEELALQFAYRDVSVAHVDSDLRRALDEFVALPEPRRGVKTIIFSADAMRKTRRHFGIA
jgi:UDP-N-acetylmuramyl tripeptide synthase